MQGSDVSRRRILYASYQQGVALPGYVRYALTLLSKTGFSVSLLTNQAELDNESVRFLEQGGIERFTTENRGFDFGMWWSYLSVLSPSSLESLERLVLINDSVVYFKDNFADWFQRAESASAEMVSLSSNLSYGYHLQSYFLYLKPMAIRALMRHLHEWGYQQRYWDAVTNMEIGFSHRLLLEGFVLQPLFESSEPFDLSYERIIRQGGGFVKRKLLEKRYTFGQTLYFLRNNRHALDLDYQTLILNDGDMDPAFKAEWLKTCNPPTFTEQIRRRWWRCLYWGWVVVSDLCILVVAFYLGVRISSVAGIPMAIGSGLVCVVAMHAGRSALRRWMDRRIVEPVASRKEN